MPVYFILKGRQRLIWALAGSYFFYGWWDWRFLILILTSTAIDFYIGSRLAEEENETQRKRLLWGSIVVNLGFLGFFKYCNFFIDSFIQVLQLLQLDPSPTSLNIILPVGISFYTFQSMSYTIDIYYKKLKPEKDWVHFATYIAFFPQLVAGPIVRASHLLPQFNRIIKFDWGRFYSGFGQVIWGFFKKVAIADSLALFVDQCFAAPNNFGGLHLLIGVIFYSFQIYCDFSGYSDIAIGLARMMGFDFPKNFRTPYFSRSFSEFWRRWHITLSTWLRDYLYIPLGGNRNGRFKTYRNLMITMLLGGLWHGANWTFVFWGLLHGTYLVIERLLKPFTQKIPKHFMLTGCSILLVYTLTNLAWIFFRSANFEIAQTIISKIVLLEDFHPSQVTNMFLVLKGGFLIACLLVVELLDIRFHLNTVLIQKPVFRAIAFASLLWMIAFFGTFWRKRIHLFPILKLFFSAYFSILC